MTIKTMLKIKKKNNVFYFEQDLKVIFFRQK